MDQKLPKQVNVDMSGIPNVECTCGCQFFQPVFIIKRLSPILSPDGQEHIMNFPEMTCIKCQKTLTSIIKGV